jgi:RhtB (resistance to homoserine/threonine) family protein
MPRLGRGDSGFESRYSDHRIKRKLQYIVLRLSFYLFFSIISYMEYLYLIGTVTLIHILALMSPGPDFIMTIRNTISYSRKTGIWTAVGLGLGIAVHITYSLAGVGLLISNSVIAFNIIKYIGAAYLIYIGIKSILSKSSYDTSDIDQQSEKKDMEPIEAVKIGFLTNVLNPKATLYFLSLFTLVISPETPIMIMSILSAMMVFSTMLWFSFVAVFLSQKSIRVVFDRFQSVFNKTFGGLLLLLGLKVAVSDK